MGIPLREYHGRRERLLKSLGGSVGIVLAGSHENALHGPFHANPHFRYLTGIDDEAGAILLLAPRHAVASRRVQLFLAPRDPEVEAWDGYRAPLGKALREACGIASVQRLGSFPKMLLESARKARRLACLHPLAAHNAPVSPDFAILRESASRIPGCTIEDQSDLLVQMRSTKSRAEVDCIRGAVAATTAGYAAAMRSLRPGMHEFDLQEVLEHAFRTSGARGTGYRSIVGGGLNSTVLHYHANSAPLAAGDLVCIDAGACADGYTADVTRTLPVSGRFSARQREVYAVVLEALERATAAVRPGVTIAQVDAVARKVIARAGFADAFPHGIGHHLGLEVHDPGPDAPLKAGAVITVEPGIYLPKEKIGIRIEDDVLVTPRGREVLTKAIPKSVEAIERAMRRRR